MKTQNQKIAKNRSVRTTRKWSLLILVSLAGWVAGWGQSLWAKNNTPAYWKCEGRVGGQWVFGLAPAACNANSFGEDRYVWDTFSPVVFSEVKRSSEERPRYMDELAAVLRESSRLYIKKRKPHVSSAEVEGFVRAIFAVTHQESFWTHYRQRSDKGLKMMRGDSGHGHGLMQIDDRWHFLQINKGVGWNVMDNIIYAYEQYFNEWERATKASCLPNPQDYRARARTAYSAYNGGAGSLCRWTNPNHKWARNDQGFLAKYDGQGWRQHINSTDRNAVVNVNCLMEGQEHCPLRSPNQRDFEPNDGSIYVTSQQQHCAFRNNQFYCVNQSRDLTCLQRQMGTVDSQVRSLSPQAESQYKKNTLDRHELCTTDPVMDVQSVGRTLKALKNIQIRATPAGNPLAVLPVGSLVQVLDFEIRDPAALHRYYQIRWKGQLGFVYAGHYRDREEWFENTEREFASEALIGTVGQQIQIVATSGINLRSTPGGALMLTVPHRTQLLVEALVSRSDENNVYYQVRYQNKVGYIYGGRSLPDHTFQSWTRVIETP